MILPGTIIAGGGVDDTKCSLVKTDRTAKLCVFYPVSSAVMLSRLYHCGC